MNGHNAPRGLRGRTCGALPRGLPFLKWARGSKTYALEGLNLRIARFRSTRLEVKPHLRDQGRAGSQALEQRDFPFPAGAIGNG